MGRVEQLMTADFNYAYFKNANRVKKLYLNYIWIYAHEDEFSLGGIAKGVLNCYDYGS